MAFIVEDGTGKIDATSYIDVAFADSYFSDRNITEWAGSTIQKQAALIKATDYIETRWAGKFLGVKEFYETPQALSFPRLYLKDDFGKPITGIPINLKKATAEYALRCLTAPLMPDPSVSDNGLLIKSRMKKVGPIEQKTDYETTSNSVNLIKAYPAADKLMAEFVLPRGMNYR